MHRPEKRVETLTVPALTVCAMVQTEEPATPQASGDAGWQMVSDQSIFAMTASRLAADQHPFASGLPPAEQRTPTHRERPLAWRLPPWQAAQS